MPRKKLLLQLDSDKHPSSFDAVVALDAGVDSLLSYGHVEPADVEGLVHGAVFTRGPQDLASTAIFIGGSDVARAETLLQQIKSTFFGPMSVSVLLDANGSNTTAAAAVLAARRHLQLEQTTSTILAGTGPVGQRAAIMLALSGSLVRIASRQHPRAEAVCQGIRARVGDMPGSLQAIEVDSVEKTADAIDGSELVIAAGAAGVELMDESTRRSSSRLKVAIDLNAVPPAGIGGIAAADHARQRDGVACYGAIGVGGIKMKIHRRCLQELFHSNDRIMDAETIFAAACEQDEQD